MDFLSSGHGGECLPHFLVSMRSPHFIRKVTFRL
jgi:hypothetical protein